METEFVSPAEKSGRTGSCASAGSSGTSTPLWTGTLSSWLSRSVSLTITCLAFGAGLTLLPVLLLIYTALSRLRATWLGVLERRYPQLEFVRNITVRTAVDTHRNQGVIAVLLTVQGACNPVHIKQRIQEDILDQRWQDGSLRFPHLRTPLTQRWGRYAWKKEAAKDFQLDKQLIVCSAAFRGRPVAEHNIQEVVSDLVSKYLAPELPPWQVAVIPSSDKYFVLVRIHHLLLSEDGLKLTDLLQLQRPSPEDEQTEPKKPAGHLLQGMVQPAVALPALYQRLTESVTNNWNEVVAVYDPLENPKALKKPSLVGFSVAFVISVVAAIPEALAAAHCKDCSNLEMLGLIWTCTKTQAWRRGVTGASWRMALSAALAPASLALSSVVLVYRTWRGLAGLTLRAVLMAVLEAASIAKHRGHYFASLLVRSSTLRLWWNSTQEAARLAWIVFCAPRVLIEDLFLSNRRQHHHFQTVSLCGRKVVAWSDPFPVEQIQRIAEATGATPSEVCLSALCGALREYFRSHGLAVPDTVLATARYCPLEELVRSPAEGEYSSGGLACLALPVADAAKDPLHLVQEVRDRMRKVRSRQPALWIMSSWQLERGLLTRFLPQLLLRLHLNFLSRRYAVALTEVTAQSSDFTPGLLWGQPLTSLMYWRPPQSNVSLSLTLLTLDSLVSLGVMSDAQLSPQQGVIGRAWTQHLRDLARAAGVTAGRAAVHSPRSLSPIPVIS